MPGGSSPSFELLHEGVRRWVWRQGWTALRDIQESAIPPLLAGTDDVIVAAATAGGKTEAAFLPICSRLASENCPGLGAIYVSPLKALINDQSGRLETLCQGLDLPVHRWHGDVSSTAKARLLADPRGLLLITPESLEALFVIRGGELRRVFDVLRYVVVDELHSFIGVERGRQLQSLMHRLELTVGRRIPRIGLSATLGDMGAAARFLRRGAGEAVRLVTSSRDGRELKVQVRGYVVTPPASEDASPADLEGAVSGERLAIADHLYRRLRGQDNLVFANSRAEVELLANLLRRRCERESQPIEFFPHHGSLSKALREEVEEMLHSSRPASALCTSTLELGIDIGSVESVAQVGAPFSVAALRQRLGRCGRRPADPSVLRVYVTEQQLGEKRAAIQDELRAELVQTIAMIRLLVRSWYEPPVLGSLHLSTLVQQLLSLIAQHNGIRPADAWRILCSTGPFDGLGQEEFASFLRALAAEDMIAQADDGTLLLGGKGERTVEHYSFYAAFQSPEEYRVVADGQVLGTLPVRDSITEGMHIIFAGRRWRVLRVDGEAKAIEVVPSPAGRVPRFRGGAGTVHDRIRQEMRAVYEEADMPPFLDERAQVLLREGREAFVRYALASTAFVAQEGEALYFPWAGDRVMGTVAAALATAGLSVALDGVAITASDESVEDLRDRLEDLFVADPLPDPVALASRVGNKAVEKFHPLLGDELLSRDHASSSLDVGQAAATVRRDLQR